MWYTHPKFPVLKFKCIHFKVGVARLHIYSLRSNKKLHTVHVEDSFVAQLRKV